MRDQCDGSGWDMIQHCDGHTCIVVPCSRGASISKPPQVVGLEMKFRTSLLWVTCVAVIIVVFQLKNLTPPGKSSKVYTQKSCVPASNVYTSSKLEKQWLEHSDTWDKDFCTHMSPFVGDVESWLSSVRELKTESNGVPLNPDIFSTFTHTFKCDDTFINHTTYIKPLSHGLRHPNSLCSRGADIVDRGYLLMANSGDRNRLHSLSNTQCRNRSCQAIYIDLGASTWKTGAGGPSQSWFMDTYQGHGLTFDRLFLWEAQPVPPSQVLSELPADYWHKYQYYNVPASADPDAPSSPLSVLQRVAQPGDFVLFKLDIDNGKVENAIIKALMTSPSLLALIDEFVFEQHVNFAPMLPYWGGTIDKNQTLADSYQLFLELRRRGVRAHSWV